MGGDKVQRAMRAMKGVCSSKEDEWGTSRAMPRVIKTMARGEMMMVELKKLGP